MPASAPAAITRSASLTSTTSIVIDEPWSASVRPRTAGETTETASGTELSSNTTTVARDTSSRGLGRPHEIVASTTHNSRAGGRMFEEAREPTRARLVYGAGRDGGIGRRAGLKNP